jgi:hypothetical protein
MGSGGGSSAPAPDPQIGQAALKNAQLGEEWLSFAKTTYATSQERQKPIDELATKITQSQYDTSLEQSKWAKDAHDRYVDTFQPLQDKFINEAETYDTPEKQAAAAAAAKADVTSVAAQQRAQGERQMESMGVNPASGRFAGINRATDLGTTIAAAGAENNARAQVKNTGLSLRANAINIGNGLPAQASQSAGLGLNAGTGAANVTNAANGQFNASTGIMGQGYQGAMAGYTNQANILQSQYNSQLEAWKASNAQNNASSAGGLGAIGQIVGMGASLFSSKKFKEGKKPSKGNLKAVRSMPVEKWRYKKGIADGGATEHTGAYAEDFKKATGHGDGKSIPIVDAIGVTMGAVQELSRKVDQLSRAPGIGAPRKQMKKAA